MNEFEPHKAFEEATERHEAAERHGATWVPLVAATLAVVTAIFSLLAAQRSTEALVSKNDTILATTHASDAYNEYESRSIKQHIYEAQLASGNARDPQRLAGIAAHEKIAARPVLAKARGFEADATRANEHSEGLLTSFATMEIGVTFLEIAIVLVSISALVTTRALTLVAGVAAAAGVAVCIFGLVR